MILNPEMKIVITCEHASPRMPDAYCQIFSPKTLNSHRGWDKGALQFCEKLSGQLRVTPFEGMYSRLFIDLNRSLHHKHVFSQKVSRLLTHADKVRVIEEYYSVFRKTVFQDIYSKIQQKKHVLHLSVHSFTPACSNKVRNSDFSVLFDPRRKVEKQYANHLKSILAMNAKQFKIRFNYPYLGISDGHVTHLRKQFKESEYTGIELEMNQKYWNGVWQDDYCNWLLRSIVLSVQYSLDI